MLVFLSVECCVIRFLLLCLLVLVGCHGEKHKKTTYVVARTTAWEKTSLHGLETNLVGFADDLLAEISKVEKVQILPVEGNKVMPLAPLDQQDIDGVLSCIEPTFDLQQQYLFSEPFFTTGPVLVVLKNAPYKSWQDLEGKEIGVERDYFFATSLQDAVSSVFHPYNDVDSAVQDLLEGSLDGIIIDAVVAYKLISGPDRGKLTMLPQPLKPFYCRLVVKKGKSDELMTLFNHGLKSLKESGLFTKMLTYWDLFDITNPQSTLKTQQTPY